MQDLSLNKNTHAEATMMGFSQNLVSDADSPECISHFTVLCLGNIFSTLLYGMQNKVEIIESCDNSRT